MGNDTLFNGTSSTSPFKTLLRAIDAILNVTRYNNTNNSNSSSNNYTSTTIAKATIFIMPGVYQGDGNMNLLITSTNVSIAFEATNSSYGATVLTSAETPILQFVNCTNSVQHSVVGFTFLNSVANASSSSDESHLVSKEMKERTRGSLRHRLDELSRERDALYTASSDEYEYKHSDKEEIEKRDYDGNTSVLREFIDNVTMRYDFNENNYDDDDEHKDKKKDFIDQVARSIARSSPIVPPTSESESSTTSTLSPSLKSGGYFVLSKVLISSSSVMVSNCTFEEGDSTLGVAVTSSSDVSITEAVVIQSVFRSIDAGAVYARDYGSSLIIQGCTFENNSYLVGGAVGINSEAEATITKSMFVDNIGMTGGGGALAVYGATINVSLCTFVGNIGTGGVNSGGAVLVVQATAASFVDSVFLTNEANTGGAISTITDEVNITNCIFENNQVTPLFLSYDLFLSSYPHLL